MDSSGNEIAAPARDDTITLVHLSELREVSHHIENLAAKRGIAVQHRPLVNQEWSALPEWTGTGRIIVIAELERPIWKTIDEQSFIEFQKMMRNAESILWVTQGGLMAGENPEAALINGFFQCLDINPQMLVASMDFETSAVEDEEMADQILHRESKMPNSRDKQFRQHNGRWLISRLLPDERLISDYSRSQGIDQSTLMVPLKDLGPVKISTTDAGRLSALVFLPDERFEDPLKIGEVEIQVKAVGMNMVVS